MKAIQTSKHCNIICMYTAFTTTDRNANKGLSDNLDVENTGVLTHSHTRRQKLKNITTSKEYYLA